MSPISAAESADGVVSPDGVGRALRRDHVGYALTAEEVRPVVEAAIARDQEVAVGACRF